MDYSRFTENTRRAVTRAFSLAKEHRYQEISPLVMMVSLTEEGTDMVDYLLQYLGTDPVYFRHLLSESLPLPGTEARRGRGAALGVRCFLQAVKAGSISLHTCEFFASLLRSP